MWVSPFRTPFYHCKRNQPGRRLLLQPPLLPTPSEYSSLSPGKSHSVSGRYVREKKKKKKEKRRENKILTQKQRLAVKLVMKLSILVTIINQQKM
jgi:hypothetical protein